LAGCTRFLRHFFPPSQKEIIANFGAGLLTRASSYSAAFPAIQASGFFAFRLPSQLRGSG